MGLVFSTNRFITWGMSHVMNLFMEVPCLTIPPNLLNRFITWEMTHALGPNYIIPNWTQMDPNGPKLTQMDPNGPTWTQMGPNGFKWAQMKPNGLTWEGSYCDAHTYVCEGSHCEVSFNKLPNRSSNLSINRSIVRPIV